MAALIRRLHSQHPDSFQQVVVDRFKPMGYGGAVQRPELQGFVGALAGRGASQGVFVTTSRFSQGAREYAASIPQRIVLIDGPRLAELMIQYRVGVQVKKTYDVVEVDEDYFD